MNLDAGDQAWINAAVWAIVRAETTSEEARQLIINDVAALLADMTLVPNGNGTFHFKRA